MYEFLAFGGVLFWTIVGLVCLVVTTQVHNEKTGWAFVTFFGAVLLLALGSGLYGVLKSIPPINYLYGALAYLGIAALWAVIKWRAFYLPSLFRRYDELREEFLRKRGLTEMPADRKVTDAFKSLDDVKYLNIEYKRMVRHNKSRITGWMIFWIFSVLETFIGDFLVDVFDRIYRNISGLLQRMSDNMASKYSELD